MFLWQTYLLRELSTVASYTSAVFQKGYTSDFAKPSLTEMKFIEILEILPFYAGVLL